MDWVPFISAVWTPSCRTCGCAQFSPFLEVRSNYFSLIKGWLALIIFFQICRRGRESDISQRIKYQLWTGEKSCTGGNGWKTFTWTRNRGDLGDIFHRGDPRSFCHHSSPPHPLGWGNSLCLHESSTRRLFWCGTNLWSYPIPRFSRGYPNLHDVW